MIQLIAVNAIAFALFHERVSWVQAAGIFLAIIAGAMITLSPAR